MIESKDRGFESIQNEFHQSYDTLQRNYTSLIKSFEEVKLDVK